MTSLEKNVHMKKFMMNHLPAQVTPEELAELEAAEKLPVTFDNDCPEMTSDMLKQFRRMDQANP